MSLARFNDIHYGRVDTAKMFRNTKPLQTIEYMYYIPVRAGVCEKSVDRPLSLSVLRDGRAW